jgi:hypothetical protein
MHIPFVENQGADFDPTAFQLPDLIQQSQGPETGQPLAPSPERQLLEQQAEREFQRVKQLPTPQNQQIAENLKTQVQLSASDSRAEQLKVWILRLKALNDQSALAQRSALVLQTLAALQACYAEDNRPKDLASMGVLYPLLKCQAYKWDALQAQKQVDIPAPEAGYLQKLRQLKGGLGPVERAALLQLVLAVNQQWALISFETEAASEPAEPVSVAEAPSATQPTASASVAEPASALEDFDPLQASRLSMQLRAKLQRTFSPEEKASIQAELATLANKQTAYFGLRQVQALQKQTLDLQSDQTRFLQAKLAASSFESWRKMRLTTLQSLARLFSQGAEEPALVTALNSAQAQAARLGLADAQSWILSERQRREALPASANAGLVQAFEAWQAAWDGLIDAALADLQRMGHQLKQLTHQKQLQRLEQIQRDWQAQAAQIKALEVEYLACSDPLAQPPLKQALLQAYAELLAQLPEATVQVSAP